MGSTDKLKSILLPYQRRWVNDPAQLKAWVASRQIGKSFAISVEAVADAFTGKCDNLILSSSERQSREVMVKVMQHIRVLQAMTSAELTRLQKASATEITLPNRSRIICLPASPNTVRGFSGNVYLDEFAFHTDSREIWRAMYPTVTRGFKVRITSTPNGTQNMFYEIITSQDRGFSKHRTTIYDAKADGLDVDIEQLCAGAMDPESWAQEYECAFIDGATAYLTHAMISSVESGDATSALIATDDGPAPEFYLGVDVGRKHDLTVFWLLMKKGDVLWTRAAIEKRGVPFSEQRELLYSLLDGSQAGAPVRRACIDATGIGAQLAEEARDRFGSRVEPVTFTTAVKEDLATTARRAFEDRTVRIPADRAIREDLHSVKRVVTRAGNTRFDAERTKDGHADRFWSLALALHAASTPSAPVLYERVSGRRTQRSAESGFGRERQLVRGY